MNNSRHQISYLEGELNAVRACGTAITEAVEALKVKLEKLPAEDAAFIMHEFLGVMIRASQIIDTKNKELGVTS